jgi:hypothetical protein
VQISADDLGRVKTLGPLVLVEDISEISTSQSQSVLRMRSSISGWRILFSTALQCMSFYTARTHIGHYSTERTIRMKRSRGIRR